MCSSLFLVVTSHPNLIWSKSTTIPSAIDKDPFEFNGPSMFPELTSSLFAGSSKLCWGMQQWVLVVYMHAPND
ncbi:unnamed protein product [Linum trigynum]|uniref:Uncharacterized protein n=1 Tax=Linum trigynum TaxID=586398 RepID=A0AAV2DYG3_9ROSI